MVADRGLGLTPLIFLAAGLLFALTTLTYVEGGAMFRERGGSSTFARHAFNELVSFIAGWAILIDYLIVIAAAAITVPHYLTPGLGGVQPAGGRSSAMAARGDRRWLRCSTCSASPAARRQARLLLLALADLALQVGGDRRRRDRRLRPRPADRPSSTCSRTPSVEDIIYALVIATIAYAGIEAATDLAPDLDFEPRRPAAGCCPRARSLVPLLYAGIAAVALMAVPVVQGPDGPADGAGDDVRRGAGARGGAGASSPAWVADVDAVGGGRWSPCRC